MKAPVEVWPGALAPEIKRLHRNSAPCSSLRFLKFQNAYNSSHRLGRFVRSVLDPIHRRTTVIVEPGGEQKLDELAREELASGCIGGTTFHLETFTGTNGGSFARKVAESRVGSMVIINPKPMLPTEWRWFREVCKTIHRLEPEFPPSILLISPLSPSDIFSGDLAELNPGPNTHGHVKPEFTEFEADQFARLNLRRRKWDRHLIDADIFDLMRGKKFPVAMANWMDSVNQKNAAIEECEGQDSHCPENGCATGQSDWREAAPRHSGKKSPSPSPRYLGPCEVADHSMPQSSFCF